MSTARTTEVAIDTELLEELRELYPGKTDRQILERLARAHLLRRAARATQAAAALGEEEAERIAYEELAAMRRERTREDSNL